jgi:two-component system, NarL family, nitrate/nitrite response regulator NarL
MRGVIVGPPEARARLRSRLPEGIEVVGEARTLREAREHWTDVDAWLIAPARSAARSPADEVEGYEPAAVEPLTPREIDVLELLAQGLPNKAIAARLGISDQTVKFHVATICGKLGASNRTDAAHRALRLGLIPL